MADTITAQRVASSTERELFATDMIAVGYDRCRVDDPLFTAPTAVGGFRVVFPCQSVWIRTCRSRPYVSDPSIVEFYNDGDEFCRRPLDPRGDSTYWYRINEADLRELLRRYDPAAAEVVSPFRFTHRPTDAAAYLAQRAVVRRLESGTAPDDLEVAEAVLHILDRVLRRACQVQSSGGSRAITRNELDIADRAAEALSRLPPGRATLPMISRAAGVSAFHLCRTFRKVTGQTLARHHLRLRLLASVSALVESRASLGEIATLHGFCSHAHYSSVFRQTFGVTPSAFRCRPTALTQFSTATPTARQ
ncbi:MAG TPA: helix-turn-helix transcriptional regulator [Vicinamibacterales bacterium]|nr:helix-turn-helix transcriptional regulator [Vicinamibacterales bacterium]